MKTVRKFPKVKSVRPLEGKLLLVEFENGILKYYDCNSLINADEFQPLRDEARFKNVHADPHGYGVLWSDEIDLAESELWVNGEITLPAEDRDHTAQ